MALVWHRDERSGLVICASTSTVELLIIRPTAYGGEMLR